MTFPKIRLYCPECKEEMTLVNTPKPEPSIIIGYDQVVEYNYQCLSNERHEGKWHDTEGNIVDDSLITQEKSMIYNKGGSNWCDRSSNEYIMIMRILIPSIDDAFIGGTVDDYSVAATEEISEEKYSKIVEESVNLDFITIDTLKNKASMVGKLYPDRKEYQYKFIEIANNIIKEGKYSEAEIYEITKGLYSLIEVFNPNPEKRISLETYMTQLNSKAKEFMNDALDIILNKNNKKCKYERGNTCNLDNTTKDEACSEDKECFSEAL